MNDPRYRDLAARQMHESEGTPNKTIAIESYPLVRNGHDFTMFRTQPHPMGNALHLAVNLDAGWLWPVDDDGNFGPTMNQEDLDHWIALLQRARDEMRKGDA